jgi:hypothetical protein
MAHQKWAWLCGTYSLAFRLLLQSIRPSWSLLAIVQHLYLIVPTLGCRSRDPLSLHCTFNLRAMANPPRLSLLGLPAELRLQVYGHMLGCVPVVTSAAFNESSGRVLSYRQIYIELETEALKSTSNFLVQARTHWTATSVR